MAPRATGGKTPVRDWRRFADIVALRPFATMRLLRQLRTENRVPCTKIGRNVYMDLNALDAYFEQHITF